MKQFYLSWKAYGASNILSDLMFENSSLHYGIFTRMDGIRWLPTGNVIGLKILTEDELEENYSPDNDRAHATFDVL